MPGSALPLGAWLINFQWANRGERAEVEATPFL
jgi:hypothetical protein